MTEFWVTVEAYTRAIPVVRTFFDYGEAWKDYVSCRSYALARKKTHVALLYFDGRTFTILAQEGGR